MSVDYLNSSFSNWPQNIKPTAKKLRETASLQIMQQLQYLHSINISAMTKENID
jgi:hypothetical protein